MEGEENSFSYAAFYKVVERIYESNLPRVRKP